MQLNIIYLVFKKYIYNDELLQIRINLCKKENF